MFSGSTRYDSYSEAICDRNNSVYSGRCCLASHRRTARSVHDRSDSGVPRYVSMGGWICCLRGPCVPYLSDGHGDRSGSHGHGGLFNLRLYELYDPEEIRWASGGGRQSLGRRSVCDREGDSFLHKVEDAKW